MEQISSCARPQGATPKQTKWYISTVIAYLLWKFHDNNCNCFPAMLTNIVTSQQTKKNKIKTKLTGCHCKTTCVLPLISKILMHTLIAKNTYVSYKKPEAYLPR